MMQVNVGKGAPSTRLTCIIISTHDPARLRPHVLAREGSVGCDAAGRFLRQDSPLGTPPGLVIGHWVDTLAVRSQHGSGKLLEDRISFAIGDGDLYICQHMAQSTAQIPAHSHSRVQQIARHTQPKLIISTAPWNPLHFSFPGFAFLSRNFRLGATNRRPPDFQVHVFSRCSVAHSLRPSNTPLIMIRFLVWSHARPISFLSPF